jgi:hypothetical protein
MIPTPYDRDVLLDLAADYLQGSGTAADAERLEAMLRESVAARDEFVAYCMLHGQLGLVTAAIGPKLRQPSPVIRPPADGRGWPRLKGWGRAFPLRRAHAAAVVTALGLVAACLALIVTRPHVVRPQPKGPQTMAAGPVAVETMPAESVAAGSYDDRQLSLVTVASLRDDGGPGRPLTPSTLRPVRETTLRSTSGADVSVAKAAVFGFNSTDSGTLYDGRVQARLAEPDANFSVTTSNLRIVDKGTAFTVERIDDEHVAVTVLDGEVEVQSRVRLPVCYWPFDEAGPGTATTQVLDIVGGLAAALGSGATPTAGLVGTGAVRFDNTSTAAAAIVGGTGAEVGVGLLAMTEGITIEAVIVSAWSGRFRDYDEIYRKEDGNSRVLLSFQNDGPNFGEYSEPEVPTGPCLSFGIHLAGRGYRELDMPLDGIDGRPTLAELTDGKPHHVVATYDSFTGRKAIFIDGRLRFSHDYPVGTMILSGGPVTATIGNHGGGEPFTGTIDELAVYDFGLTPAEVAEHWQRVTAGENYFGSDTPAADGPRWQAVTRLLEGQTMTFNRETGLPR